MKKIVGIIAAVAMAGSLFAADVAAQAKIDATLFNVTTTEVKDGATGVDAIISKSDVSAIKISNQADPEFSFAVSEDNAGALIKLKANNADGTNVAIQKMNIWVKPIDLLRIDLGNDTVGMNLNQEHITWWRGSNSGTGDTGVKLTVFPIECLEIGVNFTNGWNNWFYSKKASDNSKAKENLEGIQKDAAGDKVELGELGLVAKYAAEGIGTIGVLFDAKSAGITYFEDPADDENNKTYSKSFGDLKFGASYANIFAGINVWANVLAYANYNNANYNSSVFDADLLKFGNLTVKEATKCKADAYQQKLEKVRLELDASGTVDKLSWEVFLPVEIFTDKYANASYEQKVFGNYSASSIKMGSEGQWVIDQMSDGKADAQKEFDKVMKRNVVNLGFMGKVAYALDPVTVSLTVMTGGAGKTVDDMACSLLSLQKSFAIKPHVAGSWGIVGWDLGLDFYIAVDGRTNYENDTAKYASSKAFAFNVPFVATVNF